MASHVVIGYGMYHNWNKISGIFPNGIATVNNHANTGATTALIHIGTIRIGLNTIAPNTTGSLILKIDGTTVAFPNAFNFFDFDKKTMNKTKLNVHANPPILRYA